MPRGVWLSVLAVLRPAEACARRLIAIAAHGLEIVPVGDKRMAAFKLFDPRRNVDFKEKVVAGFGPNIRFPGEENAPIPVKEDTPVAEMVSAARVQRRLKALLAALNDIPGHAQRLARVYQRMELPIRPMRPGRPPGFRAKGRGEIDRILGECQTLALIRLAEPVDG